MRRKRKKRLVIAGLLLFAAGAGGLLFALSGIAPLGARGGHWGVTEWFLQLAKRRSVATHTVGAKEPVLDEPWLVLKGAGHYETGCRPCHGSPDLPHPRIAQAMLPKPPYLPDRLEDWNTKELFYIVKHGLKLTGMPAWPAKDRDDEVRAMVAFLLAMPAMDDKAYRRLVHGEAAETRSPAPIEDLVEPSEEPVRRVVIASCARCHGVDGHGRGSAAFPALAGQSAEYLSRALEAYARGARHSGIMEPIAAGLDEEQRRGVAEYYSRLPPRSQRMPHADDLVASLERGRSIAEGGIAERGVPACRDCHGPRTGPRNPAYPSLAGQYPDYLVLQLRLFQGGQRGGSSYAHLMDHVAPRMSEEDLRDVAWYYGSITSGAREPMGAVDPSR